MSAITDITTIGGGPDRIGRTQHRRITPLTALRHGLTLAGRNLVKIKHNGEELIDLSLQPILFISLFVYLFGGAIAGDQHTYMQFVLPGLMVQTVLFATMRTGFGLNTDINTGLFDRFRSMPIARSAPLVGLVLSDSARYVIGLVALFGLGYLLGFRVETGPLATLAAAGLAITFGFCLSWVNVLVGVLVKEEVLVQTVGFLGIFPLAFGTNMVAPTETLPGWLQAWVDVNPVTHAIDATRGLLLGGPVAGPATATLLWSAGFLAVFVPAAVLVYRRRT